jgi:DNA mismatch endonuclease (patch repair protein)
MSVLARNDTKPEVVLRRALHARGYRYRVQLPVPGVARRRIDIAFPKRKLAVFVDGCFWHRCPVHCRVPTANQEWWLWKFERNTTRDTDTSRHLTKLGWTVVRVWEHASVEEMVAAVESAMKPSVSVNGK